MNHRRIACSNSCILIAVINRQCVIITASRRSDHHVLRSANPPAIRISSSSPCHQLHVVTPYSPTHQFQNRSVSSRHHDRNHAIITITIAALLTPCLSSSSSSSSPSFGNTCHDANRASGADGGTSGSGRGTGGLIDTT